MSDSLLAGVVAHLDALGIPLALIGASALAVHGVSRSTIDQDLLVTDRRVLDADTWAHLPASVMVDIRRGDADDPLAGVVRLTAEGQRDLDIIVGRARWQADIVDRARPTPTPDGPIPVVSAADLVLLKLYAGGPQDLWDIEQLLLSSPSGEISAEVDRRLPSLPGACSQTWRRISNRH